MAKAKKTGKITLTLSEKEAGFLAMCLENVSDTTFGSPVDDILDALIDSGVDPDYSEFEVDCGLVIKKAVE